MLKNTKSKAPPMIFECKDFVVLCDGTLDHSEEAWSEKYSLMPQHVCQRLMQDNKPVFGIFVAPKIEPNLAQQLFKATWYAKGEFRELNIFPLSIEQIVAIVQSFKRKKFSVREFKEALGKFVELKNGVKNWKEWYDALSKELSMIF